MNLLLQTSHSNLQADIAVSMKAKKPTLITSAFFPKIISESLT
jgi:hypothetical protein